MTLISIIIPSYNAAQYLPDAIHSCLTQTYTNVEIIVVDDGSTDNTNEVVQQFPVTYIYQENRGTATARNKGWNAATGDYLQFLDADDYLLPGKIESCLAAFTPNIDVVHTDYEYRSADLTQSLPTPRVHIPDNVGLDTLLRHTRSLFPPHAPLIRRTTAERTQRFNERLKITEDWFFWIDLASKGAVFHYVDEVQVWYRVTPGSLSADRLKMARARLEATESLSELSLPSTFNINQLLTERHHVLALRLWKAGKKTMAREHFAAAIKLSPKGRLARSYLLLMTYFSTLETAEILLEQTLRLRDISLD